MKKFICNSLDDTQKAAEYFSEFAKPGQCFALYGNLGFGKTTFTQYLIKILNPKISSFIPDIFPNNSILYPLLSWISFFNTNK